MQLFSEAFQFLPILILPEGEAISGAAGNERSRHRRDHGVTQPFVVVRDGLICWMQRKAETLAVETIPSTSIPSEQIFPSKCVLGLPFGP